MGKVRSKRSRVQLRPHPTGLPSVKETEEDEEEMKQATLPVIEKLVSLDAGEREWACRSLCHLIQDPSSLQLLTQHRMLRRLLPLLLDSEWAIRETATGLLRNLSASGDDGVRDALVKEDVMTVLSALLKECVSQLQTITSPKAALQDSSALPSPPSSSSLSPSSSSLSPSSSSLSPSSSSISSSPLSSPSLTINSTPHSKRKGKKQKGKSPSLRVMSHQVMSVVEQGLHLLLNMSEWSDVVVEVANQQQLLLVLLFFLQPSLVTPHHVTPHLLTTAATCLYTLTEDNPPSHCLLASSSSSSSSTYLSQLEALLALSSQPSSHQLIVSASIAGVFQHLLPSLPPSSHPHLTNSVFSVLVRVLGTDLSPLLHTLTSTPPPTPPLHTLTPSPPPPQMESARSTPSHHPHSHHPHSPANTVLEDIENILSAQQLALEVIANFCYTENEGSGGGGDGEEWEDDGEEEEVVVGGDMEEETGETPMEQGGGGGGGGELLLSPALTTVVTELGVLDVVWKKCCFSFTPASLQPLHVPSHESILTSSLRTLQERAFAALQNLISALPRETFSQTGGMAGGMAGSILSMWGHVIELVSQGSVPVSCDVSAVLVVLLRKMEEREAEGVTVTQVQLLSRLFLDPTTDEQVRADVIIAMATLGRKLIHLSPLSAELLQVLCTVLRECVSRDPSVWVVALALDGLFDLLGDDNYPVTLDTSLQILPILKNAALLFRAGVSVEKRLLGSQLEVVLSVQDNLPRFIDYMSSLSRTCVQ